MRQVLSCVVVAALVSGCGGSPVSPTRSPTASASTAASSSTASSPSLAQPPDGNWSPFFFPDWQPGPGRRLTSGVTVSAVVEDGNLCIHNVRFVWDRRTSCERFVVSVPASGRLDVFVEWDDSAPGFDLTLAGDVVIVKPSGQFAYSDWQQVEAHAFALVEPAEYTVAVMSYVPASLPFRIRVELSE